VCGKYHHISLPSRTKSSTKSSVEKGPNSNDFSRLIQGVRVPLITRADVGESSVHHRFTYLAG
jgi:hypothetical protein